MFGRREVVFGLVAEGSFAMTYTDDTCEWCDELPCGKCGKCACVGGCLCECDPDVPTSEMEDEYDA